MYVYLRFYIYQLTTLVRFLYKSVDAFVSKRVIDSDMIHGQMMKSL